jgi:hypothetical protein
LGVIRTVTSASSPTMFLVMSPRMLVVTTTPEPPGSSPMPMPAQPVSVVSDRRVAIVRAGRLIGLIGRSPA